MTTEQKQQNDTNAVVAQFPNLFNETVQPTIASIMIFAVADLRRIARETEHLEGAGRSNVLDLPMTGQQMHQLCMENEDLLKTQVTSNEFNTVEYIIGDFLNRDGGKEVVDIEDDSVIIHHFGDDNALNECVHGIITNSRTKQITLTFRGSITMNDWITDAKLVSGDIANPLYDPQDETNDQPELLGVHLGFRDYLYDVKNPLIAPISLRTIQTNMKREISKVLKEGTSDVSKESQETTSAKEEQLDAPVAKNKIDVILDQVQELMDANPGYKLYITGHSLGGALALLASVQASIRFARTGIPVTCITIANPRVGDNRFRGAIQALENLKMLRVLTVHNLLDLVPSMPNRLCRGDFLRPNKFCMPGVQMILKKHGFSTTYHSVRNDTKWEELQGEIKRFFIIVFCFCQMGAQHNYRKYLDRLVAQKDKLKKLYLNDLYREQGIDFDSVD